MIEAIPVLRAINAIGYCDSMIREKAVALKFHSAVVVDAIDQFLLLAVGAEWVVVCRMLLARSAI